MNSGVDDRKADSTVEELRQSEARLRMFIAASSNMVYRMNADWTRMEHLVGKALLADTPEPIAGWMDKYLIAEDQPSIQSTIQRAIATRSVFEMEHRVIRADGSVGWILSHAVPFFDDQGEIIEWFGTGTDITERKRIEVALRQSEERYRIALQSAGMAAWDWNLDNDIVEWNDQHYYLLGLKPSNAIKTSGFFLDFLHPDDLQNVTRELTRAIDQTDLYNTDFRIIRKDGHVRWMNGYGRVVDKKDGKANRMVGVMLDITRRKMLEQQKEEFISIASHELKTPVTSIKAFIEMLLESLEEASDQANAGLMHKASIQIDRLANHINDLLDTTKISEGQLLLNKERFDLTGLIRERVDDLQHITSGHTIVLNFSANTFIQADRERIGQVLTNLVSNAIKYSPKEGEVHVSSQSRQYDVLVGIQDQGVGIATEMKERIFERFFRVPDTKLRNYPGMGLGLYISSGIIQRHGGKIWVDSEPGKGSTFYFTLPVQ